MALWVASLRPRKQSKGFYSRLETSSIQTQINKKMVLTASQLLCTLPQQIFLFILFIASP